MNFEQSEIIDSNGQKYRVGTDVRGWFSIEMVTLYPAGEFSDPAKTVEYEGEEWSVQNAGEYPVFSFSPAGAEKVRGLIDAHLGE